MAVRKSVEQNFLEAYDAHASAILRHANFRVSDRKLAEDITSETFTKAWDFVRKGNEVKNFKPFLYEIANNLITDHYRKKPREPIPIDAVEEEKFTDATDLPKEVDAGIEITILKKHLEALPEEHKKILIYRYLDELEISAIRKLTGKSSVNIYVTIHRALKNLRERLGAENHEKT